ncbi:hypothetical protein ABG067_001914 [Albugo candida]
MRSVWSRELYDAKKEHIKDKDAIEIDLESGSWIRCGPCRGRKFKMRRAFDHTAWKTHKNTITHQKNTQKDTQTLIPPEKRAKMTMASSDSFMSVLYAKTTQKTLFSDALAKKTLVELSLLLVEQQQELGRVQTTVTQIMKMAESLGTETAGIRDTLDRMIQQEPEMLQTESSSLFCARYCSSDSEIDEMSLFDDNSQLQQL